MWEHPAPDLRGLGPADDALEVDHDGGLISNDPRVMPGRHIAYLACHDLADLAISALDAHSALEQKRHVVEFAALGADDGLDVDRPPPPWFEDLATDRQRADLHQVDVAVVKRDDLVGILKALDLDSRHAQECVREACGASMSHWSTAAMAAMT